MKGAEPQMQQIQMGAARLQVIIFKTVFCWNVAKSFSPCDKEENNRAVDTSPVLKFLKRNNVKKNIKM